MKILYCGDVVAKAGREAILQNAERLHQKYNPDVFIVNGENAAHGFGITTAICEEFFAAGIDFIVTGNHVYNQKEILPYLDSCPNIIRPLNFNADSVGRGKAVFTCKNGKKILIAQLSGKVFMNTSEPPANFADELLKEYHLGSNIDAIFVDIHAEVTAEKMALAHHLDGRVSVVAGTHTHVPTADGRILEKGTAFISDVGMCGNPNGVLGFEKDEPIHRLFDATSKNKLVPMRSGGSINAIFVQTDDESGLALSIEQILA